MTTPGIPRRPLASLRAFLGSIALQKTTSVTPVLGLHKLQGANGQAPLTESDTDVMDVANAAIDVLEEWAASGVPGSSGGGDAAETTASMYRDTVVTQFSTLGAFTDIPNWTGQNSTASGVTVDAAAGTFEILTTGKYRITANAVIAVMNGDGDPIATGWRVVRNGVQIPGFVSVANDVPSDGATYGSDQRFPLSDIVSLTAGDIIKVQVLVTDAGGVATRWVVPYAAISIEKKGGIAGQGAHTTHTGFTMPAVSGTVTVTVDNAEWLTIGQLLLVEGAGYMRVTAVPTTTSVTIENSPDVSGNAAPTTVIAAGTISVTGEPGAATGAAGGALTGTYPNPTLADGAVTTAAKLAANVVTTAKILDSNVTAAKLENSGVVAGTYGSLTVSAKGLVTAAAGTPTDLSYFINSSTGSDTNTGITSGSPLQTWKELEKRLRGRVFTSNMTVTIAGTLAEDLLVSWTAINGKSVAIVGTPTSILTGTFTARVNMNVSSAIDATVTDSAIPTSWTASGAVDATATRGSYLIRKMSGANTVAAAWTMEDQGAKTCRVSQFVSTTQDPFQSTATQLEVTVSVADAYRVDSLTQVGDIIVSVPGTNVICQWLDIRAQDVYPLKLACAGSARITLRMTSVGSTSLVEGAGAVVNFVSCFQVGSDGWMVGEGNGYGILMRGPSGASPSQTFRIFGAGGLGFPGNLCLQSCGIFCDNGTAIGFANILACDIVGVPALQLATNSRAKFVTIAAPASGVCGDVGLQTGAGCIAVLSGGVLGSFTTGAARIAGSIVPNAKLGAASFDLTHLSGAILDTGIVSAKVFGFVSTTAARPTVGISAGSHGYDTTLNKPIWYDGANWRDGVGTIV